MDDIEIVETTETVVRLYCQGEPIVDEYGRPWRFATVAEAQRAVETGVFPWRNG